MKKLTFTLALLLSLSFCNELMAQEEPFIGEIKMFAGNFAPRGFALCDGQLLPISQNSALFSILGTTYGGDGRTTFGLPDLRGRVPMHQGSGPGMATVYLGQKIHSHSAEGKNSSSSVTQVNTQPGLSVNFIIALNGLYPSRN